MTKTQIVLDEVSSFLHTYHVLCAPTSLNKEYNSRIFANLSISQKDREAYLSWLKENGINEEQSDEGRFSLFQERVNELDELFSKAKEKLPKGLYSNMEDFRMEFERYFSSVRRKFDEMCPQRKRETEEVVEPIYKSAFEITGVEIDMPKKLEVRVVEGCSPISLGINIGDKGYIFEQLNHFLYPNPIPHLSTLVHEMVGHQTARGFRDLHKKYFDNWVYEVEEGFVKLLTRRIVENISGNELDDLVRGGIESMAFDVFSRNWNALNGKDFRKWYEKCLKGINSV